MAGTLLDKFSRITSAGKIIPEVEGLRFIAISTVVLFHLHEQLLRKKSEQFALGPADHGALAVLSQFGIAVPLFFTISAFILALRFARQHLQGQTPVSLSGYYIRRLTRLEPPYIISLILTIPFAIVANGGRAHAWELWPHFLASTTYTHGFFYGTRSLINGVSWSLEVEVEFYILAPIFGLVYRLRSRSARYSMYVLVALLAELWQHFHHSDLAQLFLPSYLQYFAAGFLLADIYVDRWKNKPSRNTSGDLYSAVGWSMLLAFMVAGGFYQLAVPVAIVIAYVGAFRGKWSSRLLSRPMITTVGGMCYTIYLYHFSIIIVLSRLTFHLVYGHSFLLNLLVQLVILGSIVLAASFLLFALFERPFMEKHWPQKVAGRLKSLTRGESIPREGHL